MIRKEQIENAIEIWGKELDANNEPRLTGMALGFRNGVEWADAHPIVFQYFVIKNSMIEVDPMVLHEKMERLTSALKKIASYREGPVVTAGFDEPVSAKIARHALEGE